jgi:hypothetical protein
MLLFRLLSYAEHCRSLTIDYSLNTEWVSYITTDGQSASLSWYQDPSGAYDQILFTVRHLRVCRYGAPSLTRGRFCLLQLLLSSPAQSFSGPSPAGLMTTFYSLRFETPPIWRTRSLYLYPPGTGWPGYTPRHWVSAEDFFFFLRCIPV